MFLEEAFKSKKAIKRLPFITVLCSNELLLLKQPITKARSNGHAPYTETIKVI